MKCYILSVSGYLVDGRLLEHTTEFANATFVLKHTVHKDGNLVTASETEQYVQSNAVLR